MARLHFDNVAIAALTCAVPSFTQKNSTDPAHPRAAYIKNFIRLTGVKGRHISVTEQTCTDTGYAAAVRALEKAGWAAGDLDGVVFMSQTPDYNPGTGNAFITHYRLGMRPGALAFDITLGCSSFPYGLSVCASLLQQPGINRLLMVSGDTCWAAEYDSPAAVRADDCFLFGEASTALLLEKCPGSAPLGIELFSDGSGYKHMLVPYQGHRNAWRDTSLCILPNGQVFKSGSRCMDGYEVTAFSTSTVVESLKAFLAARGETGDDYDGLVLHQANLQIIKTMARRLKMDMGKVPVSLDRYANAFGAAVTLTIADAYAGDGRERVRLLTCAFGVGLSWGIAALEIAPRVIEPIFSTEERFDEGFVKPLPEGQSDGQGA